MSYEINLRIGAKASPEKAFEALATGKWAAHFICVSAASSLPSMFSKAHNRAGGCTLLGVK